MTTLSATDFFSALPAGEFRARCQALCDSLRRVNPAYDWIGLYWVDGDDLVLGSWSGPQATEHTRIPISQGICGAAVREAQTIIVDDVQADPRYLACFLETRSEIVVPIRCGDQIIGEIDIDGKHVGEFDQSDRRFLEELADLIGKDWPGHW
ncbi:MAG: GAF domain-containing protein [Calditrichaeota bacterium]|nr:GAF domain-containing protein [Calditrichota bacterium]MCB9391496.1 GAF domain-containing protein [Calditrichota bacterium]